MFSEKQKQREQHKELSSESSSEQYKETELKEGGRLKEQRSRDQSSSSSRSNLIPDLVDN